MRKSYVSIDEMGTARQNPQRSGDGGREDYYISSVMSPTSKQHSNWSSVSGAYAHADEEYTAPIYAKGRTAIRDIETRPVESIESDEGFGGGRGGGGRGGGSRGGSGGGRPSHGSGRPHMGGGGRGGGHGGRPHGWGGPFKGRYPSYPYYYGSWYPYAGYDYGYLDSDYDIPDYNVDYNTFIGAPPPHAYQTASGDSGSQMAYIVSIVVLIIALIAVIFLRR